MLLVALVLPIVGCGGNKARTTNPAGSSATNVASTSATLTGQHRCDNACSWYWQYGTDNQFQFKTPVETPGVGNTPSSGAVRVDISGLQPSRTYQYQLCERRRNFGAYVCAAPGKQSGTSDGLTTSPCDRFASETGSDTAGDGSASKPYRTITRLDRSLRPGQTGCLHGGRYGRVDQSTSVTTRGRDCGAEPYYHGLTGSGTSASPLTITAYPGETVNVVGWIDLEGSYTTITGLSIDGSNACYTTQPSRKGCNPLASEGLAIVGRNDILDHDEIYQSQPSLRGNGIGIGWRPAPDHSYADNTIIRFNKVHDVGHCDDYDHLIYLSHGNNVQIYDNWMWNDPHGWGVQVYPGPTNARIYSNVIDSAGSGFVFDDGGDGRLVGNEAYHNVVVNSVGISNPEIGFSMAGVLVSSPGLRATSAANQVTQNDSFNNPGNFSIDGTTAAELSVQGNIGAAPQFVDPEHHNYNVRSESVLAFWNLWTGS